MVTKSQGTQKWNENIHEQKSSVIAQENKINEEDSKRVKKVATRLKESIKRVLKLQWKDK